MKETERLFEEALGRFVGAAERALRRQFDRNLAEEGHELGASAVILLKHIEREEGCSQQALTDHVFLDKTTVTRCLDGLEERRLVVRKPDRSDRRRNCIYLTKKGRDFIAPLAKTIRKTEQQALAGVSAADVLICKQVLSQVRHNLESPDERENSGETHENE